MSPTGTRTVLLAVTLLVACATQSAAGGKDPRPPSPKDAEFFEARVRPVLAENCFSCHGAAKQKAGLRLDSRPALLRGSENGPVVVPGDPESSALVQAIRYAGELKMPPKGKLQPQAVDALTAWVKMGVPWPKEKSSETGAETWQQHWAFQPAKKPEPPSVKNTPWCRSAVDRFVLARLEIKGLQPSGRADKRTLIRRATFDLLGLPPTPGEVAAFEADTSADAFARLVERLLASPHYGERWGRYWLDVARYADTKGYVFFEENDFPWAYTYRDYVIRSFNEDLPYDQFVLQQLAADRLPLGRDRRPLTALGFLTLGGRFMNNQQDILDDRIDTVTRGLLGLTVSCARCHDHKFDPIPSKDYYSLYGVFASCVEPTVPPLFEEPPKTAAYVTFAKELQAREQKLTDFVRRKHDELIQTARTRAAEYMLAAQALQQQPNTEEFMLIADGGDLNPRMLVRWQVYLERTRKLHHPVFVPWHMFAAIPQKEFTKRAPEITTQLAAPGRTNPLVRSLFAKPPQSLAEVAHRYGELFTRIDRSWQETVKQQGKLAGQALPRALANPAEDELRQVFYGADSPTNIAMNPVGDLDLLPDRPSQAKLQELRKAVETWRATGAGAPPRAMVLEDATTPYSPRVFLRGNPNNLGESVPRRFLALLSKARKPFHDGSGRLELARAIVDPRNPLTARVFVNRIWMNHFGAALVRTPSDFGMRSEPPTHPELLDYLASTFMENGWSIKHLHRLIMLSAAYQQTSDDRSECKAVDPENLLLWKMNRRRLEFEATRDALLAVAGTLDPKIGGPPMRNFTAPTARRRTVYAYIDRLNVPGLMRTFDFPSPDATSPQRAITTVPPQALFMMNNPFVLEQANKILSRREIAQEADTGRRIGTLYRLLLARAPTTEERRVAADFIAAAEKSPKTWAWFAQALLLTNEFVFID
jgi:mono/diheme cytochrome c family protein